MGRGKIKTKQKWKAKSAILESHTKNRISSFTNNFFFLLYFNLRQVSFSNLEIKLNYNKTKQKKQNES
jgi:hypothetical protein